MEKELVQLAIAILGQSKYFFTMPFAGTLTIYNKTIKTKQRFIMENTLNALIFVAGIAATVYFAISTRTRAYSRREEKTNDIFTFCMPCISALTLGYFFLSHLFLPLVITAALFAGAVALLLSWTSEEKDKQNDIILIIDERIA